MMPLDYVDHFKLRAAPFGQAPSSEFFFTAPQHEQILDELYHVTHNMLGLAVLTGGVGCGKTTMLRQLQSMLAAETYQVVPWVMHQPCSEPTDLLRAVSQRLSIRVTGDDPDALLWNIQRYVQGLHYQQRHLILLVDEAQMLEGGPAMEAVRALLNLEGDGYKFVSIVLAGLGSLVDHLAVDPGLVARIACQGTLQPFTPPESVAYVQYRLDKAGARQPLFDEQVLRRVHALAGGVPRLINTLCDNMLTRLARLGHAEASLGLLDDVANRLHLSKPKRVGPPPAKSKPKPVLARPPIAARVDAGDVLDVADAADVVDLAAGAEAPAKPAPSRSDLLSQADDIAARLAHPSSDLADEITPPLGLALPAEATVDLPGDAWLGVSAAGDFLGNNTPAQGLDPRGSTRTDDDDVVISILGEAQRHFDS